MFLRWAANRHWYATQLGVIEAEDCEIKGRKVCCDGPLTPSTIVSLDHWWQLFIFNRETFLWFTQIRFSRHKKSYSFCVEGEKLVGNLWQFTFQSLWDQGSCDDENFYTESKRCLFKEPGNSKKIFFIFPSNFSQKIPGKYTQTWYVRDRIVKHVSSSVVVDTKSYKSKCNKFPAEKLFFFSLFQNFQYFSHGAHWKRFRVFSVKIPQHFWEGFLESRGKRKIWSRGAERKTNFPLKVFPERILMSSSAFPNLTALHSNFQ